MVAVLSPAKKNTKLFQRGARDDSPLPGAVSIQRQAGAGDVLF